MSADSPARPARRAGCVRGLVDAHFRGGISVAGERTLRLHLRECGACRAYYDRHLVLAEIDPASKSARERIGNALGLTEERREARVSPFVWAGVALAAALIAAIPLRRMHAGDAEFTPRGATSLGAEPRVFVYRMQPHQRLEASAETTIRKSDDLAFAYSNPPGQAAQTHLLVYGVDEHRHVYWYYPEWTDAAADPRAIAVSPGAEMRELPHAIRHDLDGQRLTIVAVFTNDEPSVRAIEARVAKQAVDEPLGLPGAHEERLTLTVER